MKAFKIPLQIFPVTIVCYIGDKANMRKHCNSLLSAGNIEYAETHDTSEYDGCTYDFTDKHILIWIAEPPRSPRQIGLLSHEVDHAVDYIMKTISADRTNECECSAYIVQYLIEQILTKSK